MIEVSEIRVNKVGDTTRVTVSVDLPNGHPFEAHEALVLVDLLNEAQERVNLKTGDTKDAGKSDSDAGEDGTESRRSRRSKRSEESESSDDKPARRSRRRGADSGGEGADAGEEKPAGRRSRRSRDADTSEGPADEAKSDDEKPARRSRRDRSNKSEDKSEDKSDDKPARRSRRSRKDSEPAGVTDEDLTAAASEAAAEIGPELVQEILEDDHKVKTLNELPQDQREKFLATLRQEIDAQAEE